MSIPSSFFCTTKYTFKRQEKAYQIASALRETSAFFKFPVSKINIELYHTSKLPNISIKKNYYYSLDKNAKTI